MTDYSDGGLRAGEWTATAMGPLTKEQFDAYTGTGPVWVPFTPELVKTMLLDWSEPIQMKMTFEPNGELQVIVRLVLQEEEEKGEPFNTKEGPMNIYLLERIGEADYGQTSGFVVIAPSGYHARRLADKKDMENYEGIPFHESKYRPDAYNLWDNPKRSTCKRLGYANSGEQARKGARIVLRDHLDG